ncbi:MAG: hypothetical protein JWO40_36 [Candidatus Doudnabacteria bacterium]|nr:hypothetical protein [Candidatus Doudnabacteria bacterium]
MKKMIIMGSLVLLLAAGCSKSNDNTNTYSSSDNTSTPVDTSTTTPPVTPPPVVKVTPPAPTAGYTQALKTYGTNRIAFDEYCTAKPNAVVFKSGTKVMIDNRSNDQRKITVGTIALNVKPFDFQIVTIPTVKAITTITGDCADLQNVVTITVNK